MVPLKSKKERGKEVLRLVSLWRGGEILLAFWNQRGSKEMEGDPLQAANLFTKCFPSAIGQPPCTPNMTHGNKQQITTTAFTNGRLQPGPGAASAPLYNGRVSARPPVRRRSPASPITCRNARRALCASGKEWWSRYPGWCRCCSRHLGTGFGSARALAHSRGWEQTAVGWLGRKVAVSRLPARPLLAQTAPAACSQLAAPSSALGSRPALSRPALPAVDVKAPAAAPWSRAPACPHSNPLTHLLAWNRAGPLRDHAGGFRQAPGPAYIWHVKPQATLGPPHWLAWVWKPALPLTISFPARAPTAAVYTKERFRQRGVGDPLTPSIPSSCSMKIKLGLVSEIYKTTW